MRRHALQYVLIEGRPVSDSDVEIFQACGDEILEGALWVDGRWYRIEEGILDLLPESLAPRHTRRLFAARHNLAADDHRDSVPVTDRNKKVEQIEFFRDDSSRYDNDVSRRSFYVASDRISFGDWVRDLTPGALVCDIGAGSGRLTLPLAERGFHVASTDISPDMLRIGRQRAVTAGVDALATFVLADGERLPFRSDIFDAATCYGVLHHVPNPAFVVSEAARLLRSGGRWLSYDPHRSKVRLLFDWAMRVRPLYQELANGNPLICRDDVDRWCRDAGIASDVALHFFVPPHLLAPLSPDAAERCLRVTDRFFNLLGLGAFGGVIVVSGTKQTAAAAARPPVAEPREPGAEVRAS